MQQPVEEIGCHIELHHKESPNCIFLNIADHVDFHLKNNQILKCLNLSQKSDYTCRQIY